MPPKTLLRAGMVTLLAGSFLYWIIPVGLSHEEGYRWSDRVLVAALFWFCVSLSGAGGLLLWRGAAGLLFARWGTSRSVRMFPGMVLRNVVPLQRHRPMPLIKDLPNFGLGYGAVIWAVVIIFMLFPEGHFYGLSINLRMPRSAMGEKSPFQETLSVYLGPGEKYYVNGELVPREALRERLQQELKRRVVWTVYFEAHYDTLNMDAIYAMDTIQGLGARLVWITPKVREELREREQAAR